MVNNLEKKMFYFITKKEQILIEHVNKEIKDCASVSKQKAFKMNRKRHFACIVTAIGLYNLKKQCIK